MIFNDDITLGRVREMPELAEVEKYIVYSGKASNAQFESIPFGVLRSNGWNVDGAVKGLTRLYGQSVRGKCFYSVYSAEETAADPDLADVGVTYLPNTEGEKPGKKPFIVICSGGAFGMIWNLNEGFPTAAWFNRLGYDVFCLNYRVGMNKLFPRPIRDLARAIGFILDNRGQFGVGGEYAVCGFSAGAILTCLWGTLTEGYAAYGLPRPCALLPVYPVTSTDIPDPGAGVIACFNLMVGSENAEEKIKRYDTIRNMHGDYPPCYITCGKNDSLVAPKNSEMLYDALIKLGIPAVLDETEKAEHGFGDGTGTTAEGWIDRAAKFLENNVKIRRND